jgi:hypothetical protein
MPSDMGRLAKENVDMPEAFRVSYETERTDSLHDYPMDLPRTADVETIV